MDWGWDEPPHPQVNGRPERSELECDRLPEVRELEQLGWWLVPDVPTTAFLPYVWPAHARTWVPDRSTIWTLETETDGRYNVTAVRCVPVSARERAALEAEANRDLAGAGVPERPPGRLWLLRPVGGFRSVEALHGHMGARADARGIGGLCRELVRLWAGELARPDGV